MRADMFNKRHRPGSRLLAFLRENADWIAKLTAAVVAVFVAYIANSYESKMTAVSMFNQREQAESELRANMFGNLITPISGPKSDGDIGVQRLLLLTELLTLNFHEHFEFKPLLEYVDARLEASDEMNATEVRQARKSLKSIARRIVDRQIASIMQEGSGEDRTTIEKVTFIQLPEFEERVLADPNQSYSWNNYTLEKSAEGWRLRTETNDANASGHSNVMGALWQSIQDVVTGTREKHTDAPDRRVVTAELVTSTSRDGKWDLHFTLYDVGQEITINFDIAAHEANSVDINLDKVFTLSPFDFPLTDNTLLSDANRYAFVLDDVIEDANFTNDANRSDSFITNIALLKVIWFPKNYFTPRERPVDYVKFLEKTDLKRE